MNISQAAAMNVVPVLARIVLAAAFIPAGWAKIFGASATFTGSDARILMDLGVASQPAAAKVSYIADDVVKQDKAQPADAPADEPTPPATPAPPPTEPTPAPPASPSAASAPEPDLTVTARPLHRITIMLHKANWPWRPDLMAWIAAMTELLGGALMLVGLLSRIWGLGLATAMGFAFYLTSWPVIVDKGLFGMAGSIGDFNLQLGLFVLALGVAMTGPGALSMDRFVFHREPPLPPPTNDGLKPL